jgi:hypothetical protein
MSVRDVVDFFGGGETASSTFFSLSPEHVMSWMISEKCFCTSVEFFHR